MHKNDIPKLKEDLKEVITITGLTGPELKEILDKSSETIKNKQPGYSL